MLLRRELQNDGRGRNNYRSDVESGIIIIKWLDNGLVHLVSNFVGVELYGTVAGKIEQGAQKRVSHVIVEEGMPKWLSCSSCLYL